MATECNLFSRIFSLTSLLDALIHDDGVPWPRRLEGRTLRHPTEQGGGDGIQDRQDQQREDPEADADGHHAAGHRETEAEGKQRKQSPKKI